MVRKFSDRKDGLLRWLLGKGIHPQDVASALAWCEAELDSGHIVLDRNVLEKAQECQISAVNRYRKTEEPVPLKVYHQWSWSWKVGLSAFIGSLLGQLFALFL